jgi:hypothetical protein
VLEVVSPELCLIDPELARADLARADLARAVAALSLPATDRRATGDTVETAGAKWRAWRAVAAPILLSVSLAANGLLLANLAADFWRDYPVLAASGTVTSPLLPPRATLGRGVEAAAETKLGAPQTQTTRTTEPTAPVETSAAVEQKILQSLTGKLPAALVDPRTGLPKNNLQAVCRRVSDSFLCTVRPVRHRPGEGLDARYRDGTFTWYPYRTG